MNNQTQNQMQGSMNVRQQAAPQAAEKQPKESRLSRFYTWAKPYSGRIIWILAGIITAVLFLTIGFWRTILIVILALIGYAIGVYKDNPMRFMRWLNILKRFG
ncbi:hypothetical protein CMETHOX_22480 [Lacrimispora indolis]|nr:hypothetical protein CMETHOX_22480 [[Clostridium] methoxybenzovorans]